MALIAYVDFADLALGTEFGKRIGTPAGTEILASGDARVKIRAFRLPSGNGDLAYDHCAIEQSGLSKCARIRECRLEFSVDSASVDSISFAYEDIELLVELEVNKVAATATFLRHFDGIELDGVKISVEGQTSQGVTTGVISLRGSKIDSFAVGGQNIRVANIRFERT